MDQKALEKFSEELVKIRESKEITVEQISHSTRIDLKYIKAIESSDFDVMPEVYMRAFIKGYAKIIDLDGEETLRKFDAAKEGLTDDDTEEPDENESENVVKENKPVETKKFESPVAQEKSAEPKKKNNNGLIIGIVLLAVSIIVVVYFLFFATGNTEIINEKPFSQVLEEKSRFEVDEKIDEIPPAVVNDSLALNITSQDTCWVKVLVDESNTAEFMLFPNRVKALKASAKFNIVVGNGRSLTFELNGAPLEFQSQSGRIPNIEITNNGVQKLNEEISFPNE